MIEAMDAAGVADAGAGPDRAADSGLLGLALLAARSLGLKARRVASAFDRLDRVPLPALAASSAPPWSPHRDG
jgi:hypothetical protein